jgi:hypothetical protein
MIETTDVKPIVQTEKQCGRPTFNQRLVDFAKLNSWTAVLGSREEWCPRSFFIFRANLPEDR